MKVEINIETKGKFIAQYWGQKIGATKYVGDLKIGKSNFSNIEWLNIKPISSISDGDAIEVAKLQDWELPELPISKEDRRGIRDQIKVNVKYMWVNFLTIDFLRSRGYLVPWMGLSCEEIIEAGWAKYV